MNEIDTTECTQLSAIELLVVNIIALIDRMMKLSIVYLAVAVLIGFLLRGFGSNSIDRYLLLCFVAAPLAIFIVIRIIIDLKKRGAVSHVTRSICAHSILAGFSILLSSITAEVFHKKQIKTPNKSQQSNR